MSEQEEAAEADMFRDFFHPVTEYDELDESGYHRRNIRKYHEDVRIYCDTHVCCKCKVKVKHFSFYRGLYGLDICGKCLDAFSKWIEPLNVKWIDHYDQEELEYGRAPFMRWLQQSESELKGKG